MGILEKACKIRNLYNQWMFHSQREYAFGKAAFSLEEEIKNATYKKNGYEHSKTLGTFVSKEEANRNLDIFKEKRDYQASLRRSIEMELKSLLSE